LRRWCAVALAGLLLTGCSAGLRHTAPAPAAPQPPVTAPPSPAPQAPPAPAVPAAAEEPKPPPKAVITPAKVLQGDFATLRLDQAVPGPVTVTVTGLSEQPKVYEYRGRAVAFIGFPATARVGSYPVTVAWKDGSWQGQVEVIYKRFTEDRLTVTQEQQETYYDPRQDEEWARLFAARSKSAPVPYWRGAFRPPLKGKLEITTYFGEIRYVNGQEASRHSGMDFAAETGTPILAPAPGRVVFTDKLIVSGWTIAIDHGENLYTTYYHASRVDVKPGDWVETGQQIGLVGSTGFSTGPHLHWTATIGNTPVDPWPLTLASPLGAGLSQRPTEE